MNTKKIILLPMLCSAAIMSAKTDKPNIVLIMADDMGYAGITPYGGVGLTTPNLNKMAREGMVCTNFHTNAPVSSSTRCSIMTGLFQQRTGLDHIYAENDPDDGLPKEFTTLSTRLKDNGYRTAIFGKWHLGEGQQFNPTEYGFDEFVGFMKGNIDFVSHYSTSRKLDWWHNKELSYEQGYATDLINGYAAEYIRKSDDRPFFLYVPHASIHVPMQAPGDPAVRNENKYIYRNDKKMPVQEYIRRYKAMVKSIDDGVGMIFEELEKAGKLENTLVIFLSDNGGEEFSLEKIPNANGPFRDAKATVYEGGIRVPAIFYWKGKIGHSMNDGLMMSMDLYPTILDIAETRWPKDEIDGISLKKTLLKGREVPEREMFWGNLGSAAMTSGDFKCVWKRDSFELFNLTDDPSETTDLSGKYPEQCKYMQTRLLEWWKDVTKGTRLEPYSIFDLKKPFWQRQK